MPEKALRASLQKLRRELAETTALDNEMREQLAELADTIEQTLEASTPNYEETRETASEAALRFEAEHPRFARILTDVTDALTKLGL